MKQGEIKLGDKAHPVRFTMSAIERVFITLEIDDFSQVSERLNNKTIGKAIGSIKVIAYEGIRAGYKHLALPCPFKDADELAESVDKFAELSAILPLFTQSVNDFFTSDEPGEVMGAGEESPLHSER